MSQYCVKRKRGPDRGEDFIANDARQNKTTSSTDPFDNGDTRPTHISKKGRKISRIVWQVVATQKGHIKEVEKTFEGIDLSG